MWELVTGWAEGQRVAYLSDTGVDTLHVIHVDGPHVAIHHHFELHGSSGNVDVGIQHIVSLEKCGELSGVGQAGHVDEVLSREFAGSRGHSVSWTGVSGTDILGAVAGETSGSSVARWEVGRLWLGPAGGGEASMGVLALAAELRRRASAAGRYHDGASAETGSLAGLVPSSASHTRCAVSLRQCRHNIVGVGGWVLVFPARCDSVAALEGLRKL